MIKKLIQNGLSLALGALLIFGTVPLLAFGLVTSTDTAEASDYVAEDGSTDEGTASTASDSGELAVADGEEPEVEVFTVSYFDWDKTTHLGSFEVERGATSPTPMPPSREDHVFVKWDKDITNISSNLEVYAVYREMKTFTVGIRYVFTNGEDADYPYLANVEEGSSFSQVVPSPVIAGYTPNFDSMSIDLETVVEDVLYTVTYSPSSGTAYEVIHHFQTLDLASYENPLIETFYGAPGSKVVAQSNQYSGFTATDGERSGTIAADGSLQINIYYDRNQVALYFDSAGGSYLEPITGHYGETIDYSGSGYQDPKRDGFDFIGWDTPLPAVFPENDLILWAQWSEYPTASVSVVYWIENPVTNEYRIASIDTSKVYDTGSQPDFMLFNPAYSSGTGYVGFPWNDGLRYQWQFDRYYPKNIDATHEANKDLVVMSDGSTTYNIYYDLADITYTFTFPGTPNNSATNMRYDGTDVYLLIGEKEYRSGEYKITARYTENVMERWPARDQLGCFSGMTLDELKPGFWIIGTSKNQYSVSTPAPGLPALYLEVGGMGDNREIELSLAVYPPNTRFATIDINHYHQKIGGGSDYTSDYDLVHTDTDTGVYNTGKAISPDAGFISIYAPGSEVQDTTRFVRYLDDKVYDVYHERGQYSVVFSSNGATVSRIDNVWFGDVISNYPGHDFVPTPPSGMSDYIFAGWYTSQFFDESSKVDLTGLTMPNSELILYAKWEAPKYRVEFDLAGGSGNDAPQYITSGGYLAPYDEPTRTGYIFRGWSERGKNVLFRLDNPVMRHLDLVANWTPETTGEYTVYYREQGTNKDLASPTTVTGLAIGSSQTADAKVIAGYFPNSTSKSITINTLSNVVIFSYKKLSPTSYQVKYESIEGIPLLPTATKVTSQAIVTENHVPISGYYPVSAQLSLQISQDPLQNVIVFSYVPYAHAVYTVNHYQQGLNWNYYLESSERFTAEIDQYITVAAPTYPGFYYNRSISSPSGTVNSEGTLVLNLYYSRYTYAINFEASDGGSLEGVASYPTIFSGTNFGNAVSVPTPKADDGYRFAGWLPELPADYSLVTANATYIAQFERESTPGSVGSGSTDRPGSGSGASPTEPEEGGGVLENLFNQLFSGNVPLSSYDGLHWSLFNLVLTFVCIIATLVLLIKSFGKLKKPDENEEEGSAVTGEPATGQSAAALPQSNTQTAQATTEEDEEEQKVKRRFNTPRVFAMLNGLLPLALFILLEDMTKQVAIIDEYTLIFVLAASIFAVATAIQIMRNRQRAKEVDEENEEDQGVAGAPAHP